MGHGIFAHGTEQGGLIGELGGGLQGKAGEYLRTPHMEKADVAPGLGLPGLVVAELEPNKGGVCTFGHFMAEPPGSLGIGGDLAPGGLAFGNRRSGQKVTDKDLGPGACEGTGAGAVGHGTTKVGRLTGSA